jgi:hypothetical protein
MLPRVALASSRDLSILLHDRGLSMFRWLDIVTSVIV